MIMKRCPRRTKLPTFDGEILAVKRAFAYGPVWQVNPYYVNGERVAGWNVTHRPSGKAAGPMFLEDARKAAKMLNYRVTLTNSKALSMALRYGDLSGLWRFVTGAVWRFWRESE